MKAEILTIGDELLRGEIVDSNKSFLSDRLLSLDVETDWHTSVRDDPEQMTDAFLRAVGRADIVLVSGGLGPTRDDLTIQVLASTFGRELVLDEAALAKIRSFFQRLGREMTENNASQAWFPDGTDVLDNPVGTAPGCLIEEQGTLVFCMPGVPRELYKMMDEQVLPRIAARGQAGGTVVRARLLRTFGTGESMLDDQLKDVASEGDVSLGFRTSFPDNYLRPVARGASEEEAEAKLDRVCDEIRERLGAIIYGEGEDSLPMVVGRLLGEAGGTLAVAESCTGGLIAELVTEVPGSSDYFLGGVVAYSNQAKQALLGVSAELLAEHGAVSEPVARAMAEAARERFGATYAVSTTGISGPGGGTDEKPVGLVHMALAGPEGTHAERFVFPLDRERHRRLTAQAALDWVRRALLGVELLGPTLLRARGGGSAPGERGREARLGVSRSGKLPEGELSEGIRAFIAIDLDSAVRTAVSAVLAALRQQLRADEVRWVRAEALHMTLRFLGNIGPEQVAPLARQVSAELESIAPFEMLLGAVHLFPTARRPRVVALEVAPLAPLEALAAAVERGTRAAGFEPEERRFRAHLTLGRLRGRCGPETGDFSVPDGTAVTVSDTVLFQSVLGGDGAKYTPLERMQLGKPGGRSNSGGNDHP